MARRITAAVLAALAVSALSLLVGADLGVQSSARRGADESGVLTNLTGATTAGLEAAVVLLVFVATAVGTALVLMRAARDAA